MKLTILKSHLITGLNDVEKATENNTNLPILKNVLIKTEDNKIILTATNLELAVTKIIPGKIIETGEITVPFSIFNTIIKNLNSERINLNQKDKKLLIETDNYEAILQTQNTKEFPIIPSIQNKKESFKLNTNVFYNALRKIFIAAQYSDIRPEISGVYFNFEGDDLVMVATDSFRLAEILINRKDFQTNFEKISAIIPFQTVEELLRIFNNNEEELEIFIDSNQILFKTASSQIISRLIDGHFPDYKAIIPKEMESELVLNREDLINAIKLTSAFAGRSNIITLKIGDNKKILEISSADSALGENVYKVPIKLKGEKLTISFNWRFLIDGLKIYDGEEIVLGINLSKPATIKSLNEPNLSYVVMPIRG